MEVVSKEKIKPSSPTPQHLQKINLSRLDQLAPPTYVTLLFFYESPKHSSADPSQISRNLKQSLSDVLTNFRPLAGRINKEYSCIDCNDDGVVYVETRARARLSHAVQLDDPDLMALLQYVPSSDDGADKPEEIPLCIQVNFFDCGGVAIGVHISHKIADMKSFVFFMNAWAATCRNNDDDHHRQRSIFDMATHFPPLDLPKFFSEQKAAPPPPETVTDVNMVTKRFVFDKNMLFALKKLGASSQVTNPSKIEALTAFVWKNFIVSSKIDDKCMRSKKKKFVAMSAVNVRARAIPSLPEEIFGNACALAVTWSKNDEENMLKEEEYRVLISKLRNAIKKIDSDYVGGMENGKDEKFDHLSQEEAEDEDGCSSLEVCIFSSWSSFLMYEVNYGWGKPVWVSTCPVLHKNFIIFIDTKCGDGIEAWVTMADADLAVLEKNYSHLRSLMTVIQ